MRPLAAPRSPSIFILDVHTQDQIIIFDLATGLYRANFAVPNQPQGIAIGGDGSRLFVTHLEIGAGSPLPPAPPRITVWDTNTYGLVQTITLPRKDSPQARH
jgi:hypothetical protein